MSLSTYPCIRIQSSFDFVQPQNVPRKNHGWLNHIRSMFFTSIVMHKCKQRHPTLYNQIYPNPPYESIAVLASLFKSLLRVDEFTSSRFSISKDLFGQLFPSLSNEPYNIYEVALKINPKWEVTNYGFISALLFLAICQSSRAIADNLSPQFTELLAVSLCYYSDTSTLHKGTNDKLLQIHYGMTAAGHYLDHCRGNYSRLDQENHIQNLYKHMKLNSEDTVSIGRFVYDTMIQTEYPYPREDSQSFQKNLIQSCRRLNGNQRFSNANFKKLSLNFNQHNNINRTFGEMVLKKSRRSHTSASGTRDNGSSSSKRVVFIWSRHCTMA